MWDVQKTIKTVFSYSYLKLTIILAFSSFNVVPVHLLSVAKRLSGLKKLKNGCKNCKRVLFFCSFHNELVFSDFAIKVRKD